jgi:hypothetical protein
MYSSIGALAAAILVLSGCAGSPEATVETVVETVYVTPEPQVTAQEPAPTDDVVVEVDEQPDNDVPCVDIESDPRKGWVDKGKSYQQLWLYMNFSITNACDKRVKSVKFTWSAKDEFGEEWPGQYEFVDAVRLDPGSTWRQDDTFGYRHYDSDQNYAVIRRLTEDEIIPEISDVQIVFADGTTSP